MSRTLARRLVATPLVLLLTSLIAFSVPQLTGRSTVRSVLVARFGPDYTVSPAIIADVEERLGLDRPAPVRYLEWLGRVLQGDFGDSYVTRTPVAHNCFRAPELCRYQG